MEKNQSNTYTYSAKRHEEVESIRRKYMANDTDKMEQLRQMDKKSTWRGCITSIILGTVSSLLLGIGMCCTLLWTGFYILGIILGIAGFIGIGAAYPVYSHLVNADRKKLASQIIALSDELLS
ncbi:MAG: hypothetical protein PHY47_27130 [Lachnospiraceae bacterium]|nr:hypothetical protein [Lachnospiraceae bacterium]